MKLPAVAIAAAFASGIALGVGKLWIGREVFSGRIATGRYTF